MYSRVLQVEGGLGVGKGYFETAPHIDDMEMLTLSKKMQEAQKIFRQLQIDVYERKGDEIDLLEGIKELTAKLLTLYKTSNDKEGQLIIDWLTYMNTVMKSQLGLKETKISRLPRKKRNRRKKR